MKNAGICEGCEHFVRMNDEHTYFIEHLICLSDDVLSLKPVEPHLPPQENCAFFKTAQQSMHWTGGTVAPAKLNPISKLVALVKSIFATRQ